MSFLENPTFYLNNDKIFIKNLFEVPDQLKTVIESKKLSVEIVEDMDDVYYGINGNDFHLVKQIFLPTTDNVTQHFYYYLCMICVNSESTDDPYDPSTFTRVDYSSWSFDFYGIQNYMKNEHQIPTKDMFPEYTVLSCLRYNFYKMNIKLFKFRSKESTVFFKDKNNSIMYSYVIKDVKIYRKVFRFLKTVGLILKSKKQKNFKIIAKSGRIYVKEKRENNSFFTHMLKLCS